MLMDTSNHSIESEDDISPPCKKTKITDVVINGDVYNQNNVNAEKAAEKKGRGQGSSKSKRGGRKGSQGKGKKGAATPAAPAASSASAIKEGEDENSLGTPPDTQKMNT